MAWSVNGSLCTTVTVNTVWLLLETFRIQNRIKKNSITIGMEERERERKDGDTVSHGGGRGCP